MSCFDAMVMELMEMGIEGLLRRAFVEGASDLHVTVGAAPLLRVNGVLRQISDEVLDPADTEEMVRTILTDEQFAKVEETGDLDCSYSLPGVSRYRVNIYRQRGCFGAAIRVIPTQVPNFASLGLPEVLLEFLKQPQGMVLVTGPTGHGKSTTLAAMVDVINRTQSRHVITLEDPIEYLHKHQTSVINQREVGLDTVSFANGLRAALRQDPDVILIGEMRDLETIQTAVTAAETGHLVFATLHTNSAAQTVERIIDVFPVHQQTQIRIQLASVLQGIVSQRLLPLRTGDGRVVACEVLVNTPAVANLIRTEKVHQLQTVMQTGRSQGMQTMDMQLKALVDARLVDEHAAALARIAMGQGLMGREV